MVMAVVRSLCKKKDSDKFTESEDGGGEGREEEEHPTRRQLGVQTHLYL